MGFVVGTLSLTTQICFALTTTAVNEVFIAELDAACYEQIMLRCSDPYDICNLAILCKASHRAKQESYRVKAHVWGLIKKRHNLQYLQYVRTEELWLAAVK